jgi:SAM-dependent methyltransferase
MARVKDSGRPGFEEQWRQRFVLFAMLRDDDAGIAGWSASGLEARLRFFTRQAADIRPGSFWLDVGCGAGTYTRWLAAQGAMAVGLDYNPVSVFKAKAKSPIGCQWAVADVRRLPFAPGRFDGVLCFGVTQALDDSAQAVAELRRQVRPGGELWIDALNGWCAVNLMRRLARWVRRKPRHLRYESPLRLRRLVQDGGLEDVRLLWLPIAPGRFSRLQRWLESPTVYRLLHRFPALGVILSHSMVVRGRVPCGRKGPESINANGAPPSGEAAS